MISSLLIDVVVGVAVTTAAMFISWQVRGIKNLIQTEVERGRDNEIRSAMNRLVIKRLHDLDGDFPPQEDEALQQEAEVNLQEVLDDRIEQAVDNEG